MSDFETKRCAELREENQLLCLEISRRLLELEPHFAQIKSANSNAGDPVLEILRDECIRVEEFPPTDYQLQLMLKGYLSEILGNLTAARGRNPIQKMLEHSYVEARAMHIEAVARMSIAETARLLGISPAKHHAQVKKMADFMGCTLPGQRGQRASEAARKNALRQHGHAVDVDSEHDRFWKPTVDEYKAFKAAEKDRVERERAVRRS